MSKDPDKPGWWAVVLNFDAAQIIQASLTARKREDEFELLCQACGGLRVVIDFDDPIGIDDQGNPTYGGQWCPCTGRTGKP